jgi:RND family efflux transporter MFP subunit
MTYPSPDTKPPSSRPKRKSGAGWLVIGVLIVVLVASGGIFMRLRESTALGRATENAAVTPVVVMKAPKGPETEDIALPGNVEAWHEAPIYARTSGYLKGWKTDIGAHVKEGDLIAEIESPEIDAQLHQAEADLATAEANNHLAQTTAERWKNLLKTNAVSKQDADDHIAAASASAAAVASAAANVQHLRELVSFERIVAPFDGVITARNTDTGALINAGSNGTGPELFHIAETDKLRVYVLVPEMYVQAVKPDLTAEMHLAEHPGQVFPAKLTNTADALDPVTRTLQIELEVDNDKGELLPGGYAEVHLKLPAAAESVRLPVNTLLFRAEGMQIATIDANGNAVLKPVVIGRDYGKEVEITSGVAPDVTIIVNPPDSLQTGQPVRVVTPGQNDEDDGGKNDSATDSTNGGNDKNGADKGSDDDGGDKDGNDKSNGSDQKQ